MPVYMRVVNTVSDITLSDGAYLDFGPDTLQAPVTSITYVSSGVADILANVPALAVSLFSDETREVTLRLVVPNKALDVEFPEPFIYSASPKPRIAEVFPKQGSRDANAELVIHMKDMPGFGLSSTVNEIIVKIAGVQAQVLSSMQADPNKPKEAIQDIVLRVLAPCCAPEIVEGTADVQVYHVNYESRVAVSGDRKLFEYFDPRKPYVSDVVGDDNAAFAKFSGESMVTLELANVKQPIYSVSLSQNSYATPLQYEVKQIKYAGERKTASVTVLFFGGVSLGVLDVALNLDPSSANSLVVNFLIEFYDETLPRLTSVAPTEAPVVQETMVSVVINNFPVIQSPGDVIVVVGDFGTSFGSRVSIESSTVEQTFLQFALPAQTKARQQSIKIVPLGYLESRTVSFAFSFSSVSPTVDMTSKTSISSQGGDVVLVDIAFFHPVLTGPEVSITLGALSAGLALADAAIQVKSSTVEKTQLELTFPASSFTGMQPVTIVPRALGMMGAAVFTIKVKSPNEIELLPPLPSKACQSDGGASYSVFVANMPASASAGQVTVRYQSQSFTVSSVRHNSVSKVTTVQFSTPVSLCACEALCVSSEGNFCVVQEQTCVCTSLFMLMISFACARMFMYACRS